MKKYLVGGAVRDTLLKLPIKEKDWVIVGSTPQEMLKIGYEQVGKDFPVFLDPKNHEEHALARTERKSGKGYTGFTCYTSPLTTIEEDLYRRDLTINAMAYDTHGKLIDPYHGKKDIQLRILRHVSNTFKEDPLRILRVARFAAKFTHMHFTIAPETLILMQKMTYELPYLSPERIWIETKKALTTDNPQVYFQILRRCNALKIIFPELNILFTIPTINKKNINIHTNVGDHTMISLKKISYLTNNINLRFAILCHDIGKSITPQKKWPEHPDHGILGIPLINNICNRLKIPKKICNFSKIVAQYHEQIKNLTTIPAEALMILFKAFNCWQYPYKIQQIIKIIKSNNPEYINNEDKNSYYKKHFLHIAFIITTTIKIEDIIKEGFTNANISKELYSRRLNALKLWRKKTNKQHT